MITTLKDFFDEDTKDLLATMLELAIYASIIHFLIV